MCKVARVLGAAVLVLAPLLSTVDPSSADLTCPSPGDFLTGGGFIVNATGTTPGSHANFGVGGACKEGGNGHVLWGHLEYIDHGMSLIVHWTTITAYTNDLTVTGDPKARFICGTAVTNSPTSSIPSMVNFAVRAADDGQPGKGVDQFDIQLTDQTSGTIVYTTFGTGPALGMTTPPPGPPFHMLAGGDIVLHPSITGTITESCPAFPGIGGLGIQ